MDDQVPHRQAGRRAAGKPARVGAAPPRPRRAAAPPPERQPPGSSLAKMLKVLDVFTLGEPVWTVEGMAERLAYTQSSAYRYVRELTAAGLLASVGGGKYVLGHRIIELDRQIIDCDPVEKAGREVAPGLMERIAVGGVMVCGLRGNRVVSILAAKKPDDLNLRNERGYTMGLLRGAGARAILAHLPNRRLTRLYLEQQKEIAEAGLGDTWRQFIKQVSAMRRGPYVLSRGEFDRRFFALGAPIFDGDRRIVASLSMMAPIGECTPQTIERLAPPLLDAAATMNARLADLGASAAFGLAGAGRR